MGIRSNCAIMRNSPQFASRPSECACKSSADLNCPRRTAAFTPLQGLSRVLVMIRDSKSTSWIYTPATNPAALACFNASNDFPSNPDSLSLRIADSK